jgi:hypothetical protein
MPSRIRWTALGRGAFVVGGVAGQLIGHARVEGDIEQRRAVAVAAEHVQRHEAEAGIVALVAEDAVELQRVADALVDLQRHLAWHQHQVHDARRAFRRIEEGQCLFGDARTLGVKSQLVELLKPALARAAGTTAGADLGLCAGMGDSAQARIDQIEGL